MPVCERFLREHSPHILWKLMSPDWQSRNKTTVGIKLLELIGRTQFWIDIMNRNHFAGINTYYRFCGHFTFLKLNSSLIKLQPSTVPKCNSDKIYDMWKFCYPLESCWKFCVITVLFWSKTKKNVWIFGVLVYANTDKTNLLELEMKIRRLIRIIFYKHRMDSITEIMHDNKIYTVREFFA